MISTKKLIKIARKSQELVPSRVCRDHNTNSATKVEKGHFVVYTVDGHRFVFPLGYLNTYMFRELLAMSEEEFGLPSSGPITFPCDASFMKDASRLIDEGAEVGKERELLQSLVGRCSHGSFYVDPERIRQQVVARAC